jgi:putative ABC transport system permease protein
MRGALSDVKAAPVVWGAVWFSLVVAQTVLCSIVSARTAIDLDYHGPDQGIGASLAGPVMLFSVVIAVFVILWVVTAALNQRRRQLALLVLQGATSLQLLIRNLAILVVLFISAAVVSCILTPVATPYLFSLLTRAFDLSLTYENAHVLKSIGAGLIIAGITVLVSSMLTVYSLSRIRPIEALRQSQNPPKRVNVFRLLVGILFITGSLCMLVLPGVATGKMNLEGLAHSTGKNPIESKATGFIGFSLGGMFLMIFAVAVLSPYIVRWFTKCWTHLIPLPSAAWKIARQQAAGRIQRQSATIIPVAAGLSLLMTFSGVLRTLTDSLKNLSSTGSSMSVNPHIVTNLMAMLGPALIIAFAGAVSGLLITARGRSLDSALTYVSGAQIGQLRVLGILDGVITMITSTLLAVVITLISTSGTAFMLNRYLGSAHLSIQWDYWAVAVLVAVFVGAVATGVQACVTRYQDSIRIISRTIGE